jgi:hypothetical protein
MQIYGEKSEKYFIFAGLLGSFEEIEWLDWENYSDDNAARRL